MTSVQAITKYFGEGLNGRKVTMQEMKDLGKEARDELGKLACVALMQVWSAPVTSLAPAAE